MSPRNCGPIRSVWLPRKGCEARPVRDLLIRPHPVCKVRASSRFTAAATVAAGDGARAGVQGIVQRLVMAELGFTEAIDPDRPLNEVGLDSLMAVKLANSLEKEFGTPVAVAELLRGPTINQLVDHLLDLVVPDEAIRHAGDPATTSTGHAETLQVHATMADSSTHLSAEAQTAPCPATEARNARHFHGGTGLQQAINGRAPAASATIAAATESAPRPQVAGIDRGSAPRPQQQWRSDRSLQNSAHPLQPGGFRLGRKMVDRTAA